MVNGPANSMKYLPHIILTIFGISAATFGAQSFGGDAKVTLDNPQQIVWDKPTTDAEWAEDVYAENLDVYSTKELQAMLSSHEAKLVEVAKEDKPISCPECIEYETRKAYQKQYGLSGKELDDETAASVKNQIDLYIYDLEKLTQSVERMQNELRLREKGFVVVEGEAVPSFGSVIKPYAIRHPRN